MTALAADRQTPARLMTGESVFSVAAAKKIYTGGIVMIDASGYATPGATATGLIVAGRAMETADNSAGAAGDLTVRVERGIYRFANSSSGDAIANTDIGEICFVVDDQTVAKTSGPGTRSMAGRVHEVDSQGVWVDMREAPNVRKAFHTMYIGDIVSANAKVYRFASPVKGRITKMWSNIHAALTAGNLTLTGKIASTAITNGAITALQSGSAAGQVDSATPTAANAVDIGSDINITIGGGNTAAGTAAVTIEITQ